MSKLELLLFIITILLAVIGIFILYESSTYTALLRIGDKYYYIKNQLVWIVLGISGALVIAKGDYKKYYHLALPLLLITLFLLVLVFIPGVGKIINGAHRWINLRFMVFQPSELLKISLSLYLAAWLSNKEKGRLTAFLMLFLLCIALVVVEPDMGTGIIIAVTSVVVYFMSGAKIREMFFIFAFLLVGAFALIAIAPYRVARFTAYNGFDKNDLSTTSYHVKQTIIALGTSGLNGVGFGNSIQKYAYLPENNTDSIFAIYAEESGFIGSVVLLSILLTQLLIGFYIALKTKDIFGKLLAGGIITFLGVQTLLNLGSQAVLIPLTGVPLPFISYGGSSMLINFIAIGVLLSIAKTID